MRILSFIVAASLALALLQAAARVAALLAILAAIGAFYARPKESIGCFVTLGLLGVVGQYPIIGLTALVGTASVGLMAKRATRSRTADL